MRTITKTIAAVVLTITILSFQAFADCGEQHNGNRCLVSSPTTTVTTSKVEKTESFDFETQIIRFLGDIFGSIFGK